MSSEVDSAVVDECRRLAHTWAPVLQALGNPERLLITLWLAGTTSSVRDLERVTGLSQSLVSYHLRALREAGLVTATAQGRANRYELAHPDLDKLAQLVGGLDTRTLPAGTHGPETTPPATRSVLET
ncbi:helix-turn-helix transcriptional regulator [Kineosporia sp. R_H_3]|uniref:ArsR/SmtB family transcription factor n=1 Tax=Kineosporia sp. R_H_3 TaxID=1961848 RepID=UPI000B4BBB7C|nr:metalloregulator ArsR/SmtB family transcription factor [Kineosporia sp. R_H_3]